MSSITRNPWLRLLASFLIPYLIPIPEANPCSRILWNDNATAVMVGRTMDWLGSTDPVLTVLPRGMTRDGGAFAGQQVVEENALSWTSRYGSVVTTMYGLGTADGINEKGLSAQLQFFTQADFGPRDPARPALHAGLWAQYVLDRAGTVSEALEALAEIQLVMVSARGAKTTLHLALADAAGDSAIVEYIDGRQVVHHGRQFKVMTNDPAYDDHLAVWKRSSADPDQLAKLAGIGPVERFLRASHSLSLLPRPKDGQEALDALAGLTRDLSVPPTPFNGATLQTEYRTITDMTNRRYFFELSSASGMMWTDLAKLDFAAGSPVLALKPDAALAGDVSDRFQSVPAPF